MKKQYILRLDDACEKRDVRKWNRMEELLDKYEIKPIVGIIPDCQDSDMDQYAADVDFWTRAKAWQDKGWVMALHGCTHVFCSTEGGVNPVNFYSEFAGLPLEVQKEKISKGITILEKHGITADVFFAPAHTFDSNTIKALSECSSIRIVSDTIAFDKYLGLGGFTFIPQQSGRVRCLPFKTTTFCYHPNIMNDADYHVLEGFLSQYKSLFKKIDLSESSRKANIFDKGLSWLYFFIRKMRH